MTRRPKRAFSFFRDTKSMTQNVNLLTVLCTVCYFIVKGRTEVVYTYSILTRDVKDSFTDVCGNCLKYGAQKTLQGSCQCEQANPVFLQNEGRCKSRNTFVNNDENCRAWRSEVIEVIYPERERKYSFNYYGSITSCHIKPLISYRNSTNGKWHLFNLTGNEFIVEESNNIPSVHVKVSQQSPNLTIFKGYVMKLRLNCTKRFSNATEDFCLLFKVKGEVQVPFACSSPSPSPTTRGVPTTRPSTTSGAPSNQTTETLIMPSTTTRKPTITTTTTPSQPVLPDTPEPTHPSDPAIFAAIVVIGTILCLLLIGVFGYFLHQYTILCPCKRRAELQNRGGTMEFDVIRNPGQQIYRIQEEPVYAEVADVYPFDNAAEAKGKVTVNLDENPSVVRNPYVQEAVFSSERPKPDSPLSPSKLEGNRRTSVESRNVRERDRSPLDEETDGSIVFRNSQFEETSFSSLPRRAQDLKQLAESRGQGDKGICNPHENHSHHSRNEHRDRHGHHDCNERLDHDDSRGLHSPNSQEAGHNVLYEGLTNRTRTLSKFICPSCNDSSDYQRLGTLEHCQHREKENNTREKTRSFYESLTLERGTRESVYATPSVMQDSEELPEYNVLESEELDQNLTPDELVNHDYNILEPETPSDDVQSDMNEALPNSGSTDEDKDLPIHPLAIKSLENNPVYGFPWKMKNGLRRRASSM